MLDVKVHNRRVMVQPKSEESAEESLILLPSDAKVEAEWMIATAIDVATEDHAHYVDRDILFPRHMLEEIEVGGETFDFVQENYIAASFKTE